HAGMVESDKDDKAGRLPHRPVLAADKDGVTTESLGTCTLLSLQSARLFRVARQAAPYFVLGALPTENSLSRAHQRGFATIIYVVCRSVAKSQNSSLTKHVGGGREKASHHISCRVNAY